VAKEVFEDLNPPRERSISTQHAVVTAALVCITSCYFRFARAVAMVKVLGYESQFTIGLNVDRYLVNTPVKRSKDKKGLPAGIF
jgi:hypothetical protein